MKEECRLLEEELHYFPALRFQTQNDCDPLAGDKSSVGCAVKEEPTDVKDITLPEHQDQCRDDLESANALLKYEPLNVNTSSVYQQQIHNRTDQVSLEREENLQSTDVCFGSLGKLPTVNWTAAERSTCETIDRGRNIIEEHAIQGSTDVTAVATAVRSAGAVVVQDYRSVVSVKTSTPSDVDLSQQRQPVSRRCATAAADQACATVIAGNNRLQDHQHQDRSNLSVNTVQESAAKATESVNSLPSSSGANLGNSIPSRKEWTGKKADDPKVPNAEYVNVNSKQFNLTDTQVRESEYASDPLALNFVNIKSQYVPKFRKKNEAKLIGSEELQSVHMSDMLFGCSMCELQSTSIQLWSHHILKHCGILSCTVINCNAIFTEKHKLNGHLYKHFHVVCPEKNGVEGGLEVIEAEVGLFEECASVSFPCSICSETFNSEEQLKSHEIHHKGSVYCDWCRRVWPKFSLYIQHFTLHQCLQDRCFAMFPAIQALTSPERPILPAIRTYRCHLCEETYAEKELLLRHIKVHVNINQYKSLKRTYTYERETEYPVALKYYVPKFRKQNAAKSSGNEELQSVPALDLGCSMCAERFTSIQLWCDHILRHCRVSTSIIDSQYSQFSVKVKSHTNQFNKHLYTVTPPTCPEENSPQGGSEAMEVGLFEECPSVSFPCTICSETCESEELLKSHVNAEKHLIGMVYCEWCKRVFPLYKMYKQHLSLCSPFGYRCYRCYLIFPTVQVLTSHYTLKHKPKRTILIKHVCLWCEEAYAEKELLLHHIKVHYGIHQHLCEKCGKIFPNQDKWKSHWKYYHSDRFRCADCGKSYGSKVALGGHIRNHVGDRPFSCKLCLECFYTEGDRKKHRLLVHKRPQVPCGSCTETFPTTNLVNQHMVKKHQFKKTLRCASCCQLFHNKSSLIIHLNAANCRKQFLCDKCGSVCRSQVSLDVHVSGVHSYVKHCSCKVCGKTFKRVMALKVHMLLHDKKMPLPCTLCDKQYAQPGNFKYHMRTAHGVEDVFRCAVCQIVFSTPKQMKEHLCLPKI